MEIEAIADIAGQAKPDLKFDMDQKDCEFQVGSDQVRLAVNRAWIASKSEVLRSCVYGTGSIQVDPVAPISMPQFTAKAFKFFVDRLEEMGDVPLLGLDSPCYKSVPPDMYLRSRLLLILSKSIL
jgi:hypothetical protein